MNLRANSNQSPYDVVDGAGSARHWVRIRLELAKFGSNDRETCAYFARLQRLLPP